MPFFAFPVKKIAMPNSAKLHTLAWNLSGCGVVDSADHDAWLAAGGDDGLLKVLKMDAVPSAESNVRGVAAPTALKTNKQLEGHTRSGAFCFAAGKFAQQRTPISHPRTRTRTPTLYQPLLCWRLGTCGAASWRRRTPRG